jgi:hypothetical protein
MSDDDVSATAEESGRVACWLDAPETPAPVKAEWDEAEREAQEQMRQMRRNVARHDALAKRKSREAPVRKPARRVSAPRESRPGTVRRRRATAPRRGPPSSEDSSEPSKPLERLAVASTRMWAHLRRREARRLAW